MIIDTMIFAYALLRVENKYEESTTILEQASQIIVPDSFRAELANVVWQWVKFKSVPEELAYSVLQDVETLLDQVVSSERIWTRALQLSIAFEHPVYDTLYVATAESFDDKVITYDQKMIAKFPERVLSPQAFLCSD
ncbi:type II toxin-antitoxin system VapC family toxin [cf. Phormidesmis sp. LEGE 11477]|uniref:type II toxin-antitoxin system VapC family toxin n=1 Tax=cf. Phormidesmis sp. LEGE 11477 TaxID=1828680 RepID=UPI00187E9B37|nr:type II toxin-antitoxin system VapC family toxin [cf. Phormidesmis sp. LEGE 11477]MBE9063511.1 type II toxin-antitoxin system VapC family toxin [cf. Phormidesmis sp. LEGE 11477]